jgi:intracellular multiplication protein IcmB
MSGGISGFLDSILSWFSRLVREPASSFCELETVDTDHKTLISADGSLANIIRVGGSSRLVGQAEYEETVTKLAQTLTSFMKDTGHALQVYWVRDPEDSPEIVRRALAPARAQADQLSLNFKDLLDEKERVIANWVCLEEIYFVCWTHPGVLTPVEAKAARRQRDIESKAFDGLRLLDAQDPRVLLSVLRNRHSAFVSSVVSELRDVGLVAEELDGHRALRAVRMSVDPQWTSVDWNPVIPGDPIPVRFPVRGDEHNAVWWPPLASQVWPRDAHVVDNRFVRIGDRLHAPMYVDMPPLRLEAFQRLISRTIGIDRQMPWTMSFLIRGDGLRRSALKSTLASVFAVMNQDNAQIRDAIKQLREYGRSHAIVSLQIAFNTWVPAGKLELLRQRAARMAQAVVDWGSAEVRETTGDPVEGFTSTALGLSASSIATEAAPPLDRAMTMLPLTRPASPWVSGAELFTSIDGKLLPYQPGSSVQETWISLFWGGPGSGKSMQMFKQHFATCLAPNPGATLLPQIAIIDIGPSSAGLASLLKTALPANMQHYVNNYRIRNTPEFSFNPFDLQLGCERPLPEERAFLVDLLTMLATPAETGKPYEGTSELAGLVLDEMYAALSNGERGKPHVYTSGVDHAVDQALADVGIVPTTNMSWFDVRDTLYRLGNPHAAYLAQRYAVPLLSDAASAARSTAVRDIYGKKLTAGDGSETLPEAFSRMIQAAGREFRTLSQPTRFDIGESRVTIIDLDEVAKGGGPAGQKATAVYYAIAMYLLAKNFTLTADNLRDIPEDFRSYHYPRVQAAAREMKTLCCDEFHRTGQSFSAMLRERIKVYAREGRKWNIQLMLSSQVLSDFDSDLINMATAVYIMQRPNENELKTYGEVFGLNNTEREALKTQLKGPRAGGATFFVRMKTKEGTYSQLLRNPAGPIELWAGSTTAEDKAIRELVYQALGAVDGRIALAQSYPNGSAKHEADGRKEQMVMRGVSFSGETQNDLYEGMAKEVVESYLRRRNEQRDAEIAEQEARREADKVRSRRAVG